MAEIGSGDMGFSELSRNKSWNEVWWPVTSLFVSLRPLHYWAMRHITNIEEGDKVLEIGSGYPLYQMYAEKVGKEGLFVAMDMNENIQSRSKKLLYWLDKIRNKKSTQSNLVTSDATKLPLANDTFDIVVASNFTGPEKYIEEAYRVLKPGGRFVTSFVELGLSPEVSKNRAETCRKTGFLDVKLGFSATAAIIPGIIDNVYVEAVKPK